MPYINQGTRNNLDIKAYPINNVGVLNYTINKIIHQYILDFGLQYKTINDVIGVLECAKLELYRQIAAPYEDTKKEENGSVSILDRKE